MWKDDLFQCYLCRPCACLTQKADTCLSFIVAGLLGHRTENQTAEAPLALVLRVLELPWDLDRIIPQGIHGEAGRSEGQTGKSPLNPEERRLGT